MDKKIIIGFIAATVLLLGGLIFINQKTNSPSVGLDLVPFAQCLKEKKVTFFGAFWCPHCAATKKMFGAAAKDLPYVECSTPDSKGQTQICKDNGVSVYPTWAFANGTRVTGEQSLEVLSQASGCPLPGNTAPSSVATTTTSQATSSSSASPTL